MKNKNFLEAVDDVVERVGRLLDRHGAVVPLEVQIRLGEHGWPGSRIRPRTTRAQLRKLRRRTRLPFHIQQLHGEWVFASQGLSVDGDGLPASLMDKINAAHIARRLSVGHIAEDIMPALEDWLTESRICSITRRTIFLLDQGQPIHLLVHCGFDWLYPDDPALWKHLVESAYAQAVPVVLARYVDPATFALLKTAGCLAFASYALPYRVITPRVEPLGVLGLRLEGPEQWLPRLRSWWVKVISNQLVPTVQRHQRVRAAILSQGARAGLGGSIRSTRERKAMLEQFMADAGAESQSRKSVLSAVE